MGKFRKVRGSRQESETSEAKENELLKSRVTEALEKEIDNLATKITYELSSKHLPVSEFKEHPSKLPHSPPAQLPRSTRLSTQQESNPFVSEHYYPSTFKISEANSVEDEYIKIKPYKAVPAYDPYEISHPQRQPASEQYIRPLPMEDYALREPFSTKEIHRKKVGRVEEIHNYKSEEKILLEVVAKRRKSKQPRKNSCECRLRQPAHKKSKGEREGLRKGQKKKEKGPEKVEVVSELLGVEERVAKEWVEALGHLEAGEIAKKVRETVKQVGANLKHSRSASVVKSVCESRAGRKAEGRSERVESDALELMKKSMETQNSQGQRRSEKEKGAIFLKMKGMFGDQRKKEMFWFIEQNAHLDEEAILEKYVRLHNLAF